MKRRIKSFYGEKIFVRFLTNSTSHFIKRDATIFRETRFSFSYLKSNFLYDLWSRHQFVAVNLLRVSSNKCWWTSKRSRNDKQKLYEWIVVSSPRSALTDHLIESNYYCFSLRRLTADGKRTNYTYFWAFSVLGIKNIIRTHCGLPLRKLLTLRMSLIGVLFDL